MIERVIASRTASAPCPASAGPFFTRASWPWPIMGGRCSSRVKRVVRSTKVPIAELPKPTMRSPFPMARHGAIGCLRWTFADHNLRRDEGLAPPARARSRCPQHPSSAQAGRQLAAQCTAPLNEQRLIDGLMADAHGLIVREVDRQAARDLLRAPGSCPMPVLPRSMPTAFPGSGRAGNSSPAWSDNNASQSFLHIGSQGRIQRKLRRFGTASGSLGVPLRRCRAILKTAAPGGGVAPQLSRDRRGRSSKPACNLLHGAALRTKERDLLSLRK